MDVRELESLAVWYVDHFNRLNPLYQRMIEPIQHNANQPGKQPFEEPLNALVAYLKSMDFEVLSLQQIKTLEKLGVAQFLGQEGADFIERTIKTADFDPATGVQALNDGFNKVGNASRQFEAYLQALNELDLRNQGSATPEFITIRVGFQNDAAIENMSEWKDSAKDWYDIIRGLALASNEAPEATRIIGATTGSIILILAGTAAVTALLARISKHVTGVAKEGLEILHTTEDLRQKKLLTKVMETELNSMIEAKKKSALDTIMEEIKPLIADAAGDKVPALTNSIKKLLAFNEKGGNVDFVAPEHEPQADGGGEADTEQGKASAGHAALAAARDAIREYQEVREQLKLLSHQRPTE